MQSRRRTLSGPGRESFGGLAIDCSLLPGKCVLISSYEELGGCAMKLGAFRMLMVGLSLAFAFVPLGPNSQEPGLKPTFGSVKLKAGFDPDPFSKDLTAGGNIKTDMGGVKA